MNGLPHGKTSRRCCTVSNDRKVALLKADKSWKEPEALPVMFNADERAGGQDCVENDHNGHQRRRANTAPGRVGRLGCVYVLSTEVGSGSGTHSTAQPAGALRRCG